MATLNIADLVPATPWMLLDLRWDESWTGRGLIPVTGEPSLRTSEVQTLRLSSPAAARVQLRRWGIEAVARALSGEKLWPADQIRQRAASRPGRGARTDLKRSTEEPASPDDESTTS